MRTGRAAAYGMVVLLVMSAAAPARAADAKSEEAPAISSMSALAFGPGGVLFVGDGKGGQVLALEIEDDVKVEWKENFRFKDMEGKIAARLGTTADGILIHDMAVHPESRRIYFAVSRGRGEWDSSWELPNDVADADILLRVDSEARFEEVPLSGIGWSRVALPNPVSPDKSHPWKKDVPLRADTITDLAYSDGTLWVAGLSNEEFASTLWRVPYPFGGEVAASTLEVFHGAHGEYETHAPIRTFVPYRLKGEPHLLAAYLCTPFVSFRVADLAPGRHVRGRTLGEFGFGNYPLDMVVYEKDGKERLLIANSNLPLMIVKPEEIEAFEGEIVEKTRQYTEGLPFEMRSGTGIQQLAVIDAKTLVVLGRLPGGTMDMQTVPAERF